MTQRTPTQLSELIQLIYDAGTHPARWNEVVTAIAKSFGSTKGLLFTPYLAPQYGGLLFPVGISEDTLQLWASSYINHDIWAANMQKKNLWRNGAVARDEQMVPWDEFLASRFYREFLSTIDIGRVCLGMVFDGAPGLPPTSLSVFRALNEPPFNESDNEWMELIVSHVSRSLGVMQRLDIVRLQQGSALAAFDRLHFGVALLNKDMQVVHLNHAAKAVIERSDGLMVSVAGELQQVMAQKDGTSLSQWLSGALEAPESSHLHFLNGRSIACRKGKRRYMIQCSAVSRDNNWEIPGDDIHFAVFITDPEAQPIPCCGTPDESLRPDSHASWRCAGLCQWRHLQGSGTAAADFRRNRALTHQGDLPEDACQPPD